MPYPTGHRYEVKRRILDSARKLFNRHGFDSVSLDRIMLGAGLTRGGFYKYFTSKSELYAQVLNCFFTDPEWKNCWEGVEVDLASKDAGQQVVQAYLSRQHFEDVENSCPMVALPSDVMRSDARAKGAFQTVFTAMVGVLERSVNGDPRTRRTRAKGIAAMCVGGMVVARAMADRPPRRRTPRRLHGRGPPTRRLALANFALPQGQAREAVFEASLTARYSLTSTHTSATTITIHTASSSRTTHSGATPTCRISTGIKFHVRTCSASNGSDTAPGRSIPAGIGRPLANAQIFLNRNATVHASCPIASI
jgi:AcrR family transcriptional regulator